MSTENSTYNGWGFSPQWSLRKNHARRAGHDYFRFLTFQLAQGWGQGQET
ncbi:hypothetical protein [Gimesia aquarii]|uniref:Uncharacterized protein n=1 Tax=Gimesia aquarii TaxID=2527964 RepID=A0A517WX70_9PLAN|nr:hypothetical protein [Gimesia aquarii]QDU09828.1 hypothetical protein V202x_32250 [Gimesia aquarii]